MSLANRGRSWFLHDPPWATSRARRNERASFVVSTTIRPRHPLRFLHTLRRFSRGDPEPSLHVLQIAQRLRQSCASVSLFFRREATRRQLDLPQLFFVSLHRMAERRFFEYRRYLIRRQFAQQPRADAAGVLPCISGRLG